MEEKKLSDDEIEGLLKEADPVAEEKPIVEDVESEGMASLTQNLSIESETQEKENIEIQKEMLNNEIAEEKPVIKLDDLVNIDNKPGQVNMVEIAFPNLSHKTGEKNQVEPNMNLLMDVQMSLTVELGRTKMFIKEILGLGEGSIIELDKLAGEPVDLLVNGKLVAKGEVVVIDENFGVRVTDIVTPSERIKIENKEIS